MAAPAAATGPDRDFAVAPMALDAALARFAIQSGADVGASDGDDLARVRTRGVAGRMSPRAALRRLLAGTPYRAVPVPGGYRIVRAAGRTPPVPTRAAPAEAAAPGGDIVVTAGKRDVSRLRFAGGVAVVELGAGSTAGLGASDTLADVAAQAPTVQATALGAGRDKLFVRGIADSSFLGPTRATTSVYFGNVLLGYGGGDPNLKLYDVDRVEIVEGPQGTLYGAGAIGGVIKIAPRAPDLAETSAVTTVSVTATQGGDLGYDAAAVLNLPLLDDRAGVRLVGYRVRDGGYIDDRERGLDDVNRTATLGGRAALRLAPGDGWTVDAGVVAQSIDAADTQYALRALRGLARRSAIAQPFRDHVLLGRLEVAKVWDNGLRLVSATGLADDTARDRFDATTQPNAPFAYDTHERNRLLTQETRLSRTSAGGDSWLIGVALLHDRDVTSREYGRIGAERSIVGVTNRTREAALFGEATLALGSALAVTAGARLTDARIESSPSVTRNVGRFIPGRRQTRLDPTIALSWLVAPRVALFARYQPGFRTGGLAVAPGIGRVSDFRSDHIRVGEAGVRLERSGAVGLAASAGLSVARWRNIQADLISGRGFPYTANVGDGRITGLEASADWVPRAGVHLTGGLFATDSHTTPDRDAPPIRATRLPDTPRFAGNASASCDRAWQGGLVRLSASARYVGPSYLDRAALLNLRQGDYADFGVAVGWRRGALAVGLDVDNLANARGDRFALGNPFGVARGDQFTPLRPRNARLTASVGW